MPRLLWKDSESPAMWNFAKHLQLLRLEQEAPQSSGSSSLQGANKMSNIRVTHRSAATPLRTSLPAGCQVHFRPSGWRSLSVARRSGVSGAQGLIRAAAYWGTPGPWVGAIAQSLNFCFHSYWYFHPLWLMYTFEDVYPRDIALTMYACSAN